MEQFEFTKYFNTLEELGHWLQKNPHIEDYRVRYIPHESVTLFFNN